MYIDTCREREGQREREIDREKDREREGQRNRDRGPSDKACLKQS